MKEKVVGVVREGLPLVANQPETSQDRYSLASHTPPKGEGLVKRY